MGQENLIKKLIFGWQYVPIADDFLRGIKRKKLVYIRMIDFDKNQRKCSKIEKFTNLLLKYAKRLFIGVQTWSCAQLNCAGNPNVENSTCFILTNVVKFPLYFFLGGTRNEKDISFSSTWSSSTWIHSMW